MDKDTNNSKSWIWMISVSPIATLALILTALVGFLRFFFKASLLFIIASIYTPFAMMFNVSRLVFKIYGPHIDKWCTDPWNSSDPRASVGIEIQIIVFDFFIVVANELLVVISTGIITFFTAPRLGFYISMVILLVAILHKWLNMDSKSKTALSCLCARSGLNPMMFFFSFIGFFNIGCHPVAKCSFVAKRAFLFVKEESNKFDEEANLPPNLQDYRQFNHRESPVTNSKDFPIDFLKWNAFEKGSLFELCPRIDFKKTDTGKCILKSSMILKFREKNKCQYPMDRLELPEDYSKIDELYNFLVTLSLDDGFVTDKMRGRYEHSLKLSEIVERVEENDGYRIVDPKDDRFLVAGCID